MPPHTDANSDASSSFEDLRITASPSYSSAAYRFLRNFSAPTTAAPQRLLHPGIYCPTPAFFDPITEDLDLETTRAHAIRLARAGMTGLVTQGSNGEAVHLSHSERRLITAATREALDSAGFCHLPVLVGCGSQSTRETIELCHDAFLSGGDYAMILPPSYYRTLYTGESQLEFFRKVADESPIPILIYNFPGAVSGIDLDSDTIIALSKHRNIVGCKLTCGNTGKLGRVAAGCAPGFVTLAGSCDFTLQSLVVGGKGVIGGLANIAPFASVATYELYMNGQLQLAQQMQQILGRGDWVVIKTGVVGTKAVLNKVAGYGGFGRRPLPRLEGKEKEAVEKEIEELEMLEEFLAGGRRAEDVHASRAKEFPVLVDLERRLVEA